MNERKLKIVPSNAAHRTLRIGMAKLLREATERDGLSAQEALGIVAQITGQVMGFQDQRKLTPDDCMEIVTANLEIGKRDALKLLREGMQ